MREENRSSLAPIALFVFNRPAHTQKLLQSLLANKEAERSDLYIFCDSSKYPEQDSDVAAVRSIVAQIDGFARVEALYHETNKGLAQSIIYGVSKLCREYGRVIVLEDDLVLSAFFLRYMNEALDFYADDKKVMQISGFQFPIPSRDNASGLLPYTTSWGWATWERAWENFDPSFCDVSELNREKDLRYRFDFDGTYPAFKMLKRLHAGAVSSWAIRWYHIVFSNQGLVLYPPVSFVNNLGEGEAATNPSVWNSQVAMSLAGDISVKHGSNESVDEHMRISVVKHLKSERRIFRKLLGALKNSLWRKK